MCYVDACVDDVNYDLEWMHSRTGLLLFVCVGEVWLVVAGRGDGVAGCLGGVSVVGYFVLCFFSGSFRVVIV
jgi:hypothetical protein